MCLGHNLHWMYMYLCVCVLWVQTSAYKRGKSAGSCFPDIREKNRFCWGWGRVTVAAGSAKLRRSSPQQRFPAPAAGSQGVPRPWACSGTTPGSPTSWTSRAQKTSLGWHPGRSWSDPQTSPDTLWRKLISVACICDLILSELMTRCEGWTVDRL